MKKFWRSGMIDKKVFREREQAEYINRLERAILELRKEPNYDSDIKYDKTLNENRKAKGFKEV